jgi:hypothetical protein
VRFDEMPCTGMSALKISGVVSIGQKPNDALQISADSVAIYLPKIIRRHAETKGDDAATHQRAIGQMSADFSTEIPAEKRASCHR